MTPLIPATAPDESNTQPAAEAQGVQPIAGGSEAMAQPAADAEEGRVPPATDLTPTTDSTNDDPSVAPAAEEPSADAEKNKIAPIWIAATLCVGLLIAVIYLGARIISTHRTAKPATAVAATPIASPVQKPLERPVEATVVVPEHSPASQVVAGKDPQPASTPSTDPLALTGKDPQASIAPRAGVQAISGKDPLPASITPQPGQRYLQVGALDYSEATRRFIEKLQGENLDPKVAPGPKPQLLRVLIGPFDNRDALEEKKAQIEAEGLDTFVREY